jgi:hypothetical protein
MTTADLTDKEIDLLIEGLDAIEHREAMSNTIGALMGNLMCRDDETARLRMEEEIARREEERASAVRARRERVILAKAKLVQIRQAKDKERFVREAAESL